MLGPDPFMVGDHVSLAPRLDPVQIGVPPSFRTADRLRSIPERRGIHVREIPKVFAGVS
jgi:hypothetical protein